MTRYLESLAYKIWTFNVKSLYLLFHRRYILLLPSHTLDQPISIQVQQTGKALKRTGTSAVPEVERLDERPAELELLNFNRTRWVCRCRLNAPNKASCQNGEDSAVLITGHRVSPRRVSISTTVEDYQELLLDAYRSERHRRLMIWQHRVKWGRDSAVFPPGPSLPPNRGLLCWHGSVY